MAYYFLRDELFFPPVHIASREGIVAVGGDLSVERLLLAYRSGIFPWFSEGEPIIWWSPEPRFVLYPNKIKISKSMKQLFKKKTFEVTLDKNFEKVISNCQKIKRKGQFGTWITPEMKNAYIELHKLGYAHSIEVWQEGKLVGGLYGVCLGSIFFGESMFSKVSNASKYGLITLCKILEKNHFYLVDCQVYTEHLESLGAEFIPRQQFIQIVSEKAQNDTFQGNWGEIFAKDLAEISII
ncbi:MAG: leucyl/phenylalanyl-tRNA--protein transferase [Raineya sp.]|nr:leucyl/phenylalanyl-tRNA--protein transferase [Raineya sp.]MDW8296264.1 leucyl/phenylalanyl-tRNA--protein transferase [Raineya sp.]